MPDRRKSDDKSKQMNYRPNMYSNPVLNYLQRQTNSGIKNKVEEENKGEEIVPKGHYIKRKITHKQTYYVPNTQMMQIFESPIIPFFKHDFNSEPVDSNKATMNLSKTQAMELAKQQFLINNIKNIVSDSQTPQPYSNIYNPYAPQVQQNQFVPNFYQGFPMYPNYLRTPISNPNNLPVPFSDTYFANLQTLKPYDSSRNIQPYDTSNDYGSQDISSQTIRFPHNPNHFSSQSRIQNRRQNHSDAPKNTVIQTAASEDKHIRRPEVPKQLGPYQEPPDFQSNQQFNLPTPNFNPLIAQDSYNGVYSSITSMVEYGQKEEGCEKNADASSMLAVRSGKGLGFDLFDMGLLSFLDDVMRHVNDEEHVEEEQNKGSSTEEILTEDESVTEIIQTTNQNESDSVVRKGREISFANTEKGRKIIKLLEHIKEEEAKSGPRGIIKYLEKVINHTKDEDASFELEGIQIVDDDDGAKQPKQLSAKFQLPSLTKDKNTNDDKFFDKTSGSGIFINKLRVRKGGVAIAGPGGIATAGSGGTAIVGPNGVAYTQPNGIAIAGPGSRVIAVDPSVDLNKFVSNLANNGSSARIGKVVAIGPVVYYHKEQ